MRRLTLSKRELAEHCLYSFREDTALDPPTSNPAQALGNAFHEWVASVIATRPQSLDEVSAHYGLDDEARAVLGAMATHWQATRTPLLGWQAELAYAYNVVTGECRVLGRNIARQYAEHGAGEHDVCGTADLMYWDWPAETLVIEDWKSGAQRNLAVTGNLQLRGLGAVAARAHGSTRVRVVVSLIDDDGVRSWPEEMNLAEIDAELLSIANRAEEIELCAPEPRPGTWCGDLYCNAVGQCPAVVQIAEAALAATPEGRRHLPMVVGPEALGTVDAVSKTLSRLVALDAQSEAIWLAVKARVRELDVDIPLEGGGAYGAILTTRESIVADQEAVRILDAHKIDAAIKKTITKASVVEAVKAIAPRGKAAAMEREIMGELRAAGATRSTSKPGLGFKERA